MKLSMTPHGHHASLTPDKRRSTVGATELQSSLARFHQVYNMAASSHREDDETSDDDGSICLVSSDSEDDADAGVFHPRVAALTASALQERELNLYRAKSRELEEQSEAINRLANSLARQLSDSHSAKSSRKSSLVSQASSSRKASASTIVLYDLDQMRAEVPPPQSPSIENDKLRLFLQSKSAKRRSSSSQVEKSSQNTPASSLFMF
ncbi:Aste57867_20493 [Aphanomyces stellatus]|uniref:Aste57867_20493 protein n=1 Tax=Aphanomyces stellatus TaxID=120398 RepID=A0A485LF74_9STRA|nr:hypothetical protein As57867_020427 [Aphanomyces stellatus]VFT97178.1 Aste57867_20493 [Aphanomyces stellatus]